MEWTAHQQQVGARVRGVSMSLLYCVLLLLLLLLLLPFCAGYTA
jgi:hypothetical protein